MNGFFSLLGLFPRIISSMNSPLPIHYYFDDLSLILVQLDKLFSVQFNLVHFPSV